MVHKTSSYLAIIVSLSLRSRPLSKVVTNNLDVDHLTKEAFTESQNSEEIRRAFHVTQEALATSNTSRVTQSNRNE